MFRWFSAILCCGQRATHLITQHAVSLIPTPTPQLVKDGDGDVHDHAIERCTDPPADSVP